ncbi:glucokinase [Pseudohongiella spirulinae]|uniref:Glucokinase n=1 Tax=Pseudohongiella spirulinae TaxID=1249552 RepID=A0A0S2KFI9_9GAMM|nr:glucokinase [Pseudohongiella spirulinae]ALO46883.1 hypothetical protein PS2015_2248 [Pseudohongiella spirulinae]
MPDKSSFTPITLVADIGGTHARFALSQGRQGVISHVHTLLCHDFASLELAIKAYLDDCRAVGLALPGRACLAVAAATDQDIIALTNNHWRFSQLALSATLGIPVQVINDFTAQAWCLPTLGDADLQWLQKPQADWSGSWHSGNRSIAGPGTGFGAATMTRRGEVLESEPGQAAFAPLDIRQRDILTRLWSRYSRVSADHLLSGPGLANIHLALCEIADRNYMEVPQSAAEIVLAARNGDLIAGQAIAEFNRMLGAVCGDLALIMGSSAGFFFSGAMLQKMGDLFDHATVMTAFSDKGKYSDWCSRVPVALVTLPDLGLRGCAIYASRHLHADPANHPKH